jgi:hypothetical protein
MLSGIPPEALIELRKKGAMANLREAIRAGVRDIDSASPESLSTVTDEVIGTIDRTLEEHERQLKDFASSRRRFYGLDVSRWIVFGGLSVAATLTKNLLVGLAAAASPYIVGAPAIPDLTKRWHELQAQSQTLQRSPTAILFRHLGGKFGFSSRG